MNETNASLIIARESDIEQKTFNLVEDCSTIELTLLFKTTVIPGIPEKTICLVYVDSSEATGQ